MRWHTGAVSPSERTTDLSGTRVLVTGATGYVGARLVPRLLADGAHVTVMVRDPAKLEGVPWRERVEVRRGDLQDADSMRAAFAGSDVAYYLVHSMGGADDFEAEERRAATAFAEAAADAGISRIVYLSGLHPEGTDLSPHLRSRVEVGRILLESPVRTVVLQAGVVIGAGSASFEMIRFLTDRLPAMVTPKWVHNSIQPIAVADAVHYLAAAAACPLDDDLVADIGGPDVYEYGEIMQIYAEESGLRRRPMLVVPLFSPWLASHWVGLVTPLPTGLAKPLVQSLQCDAVVDDPRGAEVLGPPPGGTTPYRDAVRAALDGDDVPPTWDDADPLGRPARLLPSDPDWAGPRPPRLLRAGRGR